MRIGRVVTLGIAIGAIAGGLVAQDGEEVIFVGAGNAGSWHTEFEFSNGLDVPIHAGFVILEKAAEACVMGFCPGKGFDMPANGSVREDSIGPPVVWDGVRTYLVDSDERIPTVRAWLVNQARPTQTIELPGVRLATIATLQPAILSFPSALRTVAAHSNLVVAEVGNTGDLSVLVEAFSAEGEMVGSHIFGISATQTLFLVDVLESLGVSELTGGQIRVRKLDGDGLMWGLLATLHDDGRISVSLGANP